MKLWLIILLSFFTGILFSQDIIIKKTGDEIEAIVQEIGPDEIKYKKFSNSNGPTYIINKQEVFMIKYENGTKDVFKKGADTKGDSKHKTESAEKNIESELLRVKNGFFSFSYYQGGSKVSKARFVRALKSDVEAYSYYSGYGTNRIAANAFSGLSFIGALIAVYYSRIDDRESAIITAVASLISGVIARVFDNKASRNLELAVLTYNQNLAK